MFTKLNINHNFSLQSSRKLKFQHGKVIDDAWRGVSYYEADIEMDTEIKKYIPEKYRNYFDVTLMIISGPYIPPHIDDGAVLAAMNFYMETSNACTYFHQVKDNVIPTMKTLPSTGSTGKFFAIEDLETVSQFKANRGEVYLLDVSKIHSVSIENSSDREAYCLQTNELTYTQVLEILAEGEFSQSDKRDWC
jgi:hypothetical protein